jgi:AP-3 complex subunit beta
MSTPPCLSLSSPNRADELLPCCRYRRPQLISKAHPVASFFPHVIKLVSTPTLELRKLIYIYILRHAESEPDLALLCINTFQKDLNDPNPLIRSMAIRVLSGIRVPMVGGVVELAVKKGASDPNPHVRKAAALAIPKLYGTDSAHYATLLPILTGLLADPSSIPLGAAVTAFLELCPHRLDALHPHFRRYCALLVEADEWTQLVLMDVLGRYARTMLERPPHGDDDNGEDGEPDEDLVLLLSATGALLYSPSPAVVLAVARLHHLLSPPPPTPLPHLAPPLLKLLHHSDSGIRLAVLRSCAQLARERPDVFDDEVDGEGRWKAFLLSGGEGGTEARTKLEVLQELVSESNVRQVVEELIVRAKLRSSRLRRHSADL